MAGSHKYPPWRRVILVPFWTLQILFMIIMIGILALAVGVLNAAYDPNKDYGFGSDDKAVDDAVQAATNYVGPVWISLSALCLILTISEIVLLTRRKLSPRKFLIINIIKSLIWTVLFALDIYAWASSTGRRETALGVVIELGLVLSFWIPLLYGSIIFHRTRKAGKYNPLANPAQFSASQRPIHLESTTYPSQTSGTTGHYANDARYESYKTGGGYGDVGLAHNSPNPGLASPPVPQVYVQHHDNVYEMDNARRNLH